jgi:hypothetical protein
MLGRYTAAQPSNRKKLLSVAAYALVLREVPWKASLTLIELGPFFVLFRGVLLLKPALKDRLRLQHFPPLRLPFPPLRFFLLAGLLFGASDGLWLVKKE